MHFHSNGNLILVESVWSLDKAHRSVRFATKSMPEWDEKRILFWNFHDRNAYVDYHFRFMTGCDWCGASGRGTSPVELFAIGFSLVSLFSAFSLYLSTFPFYLLHFPKISIPKYVKHSFLRQIHCELIRLAGPVASELARCSYRNEFILHFIKRLELGHESIFGRPTERTSTLIGVREHKIVALKCHRFNKSRTSENYPESLPSFEWSNWMAVAYIQAEFGEWKRTMKMQAKEIA